MLRPVPKRAGIAIAAAAALIAGINLIATPGAGADGTTIAGNKNCADVISGSEEIRVNAPADGTYSSNGFSVTIDVKTLLLDDPHHDGLQAGSQVFDFDATGGSVVGIAVKGGPDTNFYDYRPGGVSSGNNLHAPVNPKNQRFYGLSHVSFCYRPVVPDQIQLKKVDDSPQATPLAGAVLQLWRESNQTPGLQTGASPDTKVGNDCTTGTDGIGDCKFTVSVSSTYYGRELSAPPNYSCCAPVQSTTVTLDTKTDVIVLTFKDTPATGQVKVVKKDDSGASMNGVVFRLTGTSNLGNSVDRTCTTAAGQCTIAGVELGTYQLNEISGIPTTHGTDPNLPYIVVIDDDGETVEITVTNPRLHKVIVIVCHEGTNTLAATTVQNGTGTKTSIGTPPVGISQSQLCNLGGATWGGFSHADDKTTKAQFSTTAHP